ncbi:MAG: C-GCAxxG-C-C family protein [Oscillospiraceae bacterium]|nr:C-GCAxxG-C-C family protein [Oscillospiraceae bacterium]
MTREETARSNFLQGYNCAQAVLLAFGDKTGLDEKTAAAMASSFGGGIGRMREICGAVSGMLLALGAAEGYTDPKDALGKKTQYALVQRLAGEFRAENGSILCRELLAGPASTTPTPDARTADYYKKRPCSELVACAAGILERYFAAKEED